MHTSYDTALYLFPNACDRILLLLLVHISRQPPSTLPPPPPPPTIVTRANHFAKISHMIRCAACVCLPSSSACICYAMCVMCDVCERDGENAPHKSSEKLFRSKNALRMNAHCIHVWYLFHLCRAVQLLVYDRTICGRFDCCHRIFASHIILYIYLWICWLSYDREVFPNWHSHSSPILNWQFIVS